MACTLTLHSEQDCGTVFHAVMQLTRSKCCSGLLCCVVCRGHFPMALTFWRPWTTTLWVCALLVTSSSGKDTPRLCVGILNFEFLIWNPVRNPSDMWQLLDCSEYLNYNSADNPSAREKTLCYIYQCCWAGYHCTYIGKQLQACFEEMA